MRPKLLPERVAPASFQPQALVDKVFAGLPYVIAIFDNILVVADSYPELLDRLPGAVYC